jgi:predicted secreted protein
MATVAGKNSRLKVCTTSTGTYAVVTGVKSFNHAIDGAMIDDSEMGVLYVQRIQGLKDGKVTVQGSRRTDDTTGQEIMQSSFLNDSDLFVQVLFNGTNGFKQQMRVSKWTTDTSVEDKVAWSCELEGTGAITAV